MDYVYVTLQNRQLFYYFNIHECKHSVIVVASTRYPWHTGQVMKGLSKVNLNVLGF